MFKTIIWYCDCFEENFFGEDMLAFYLKMHAESYSSV